MIKQHIPAIYQRVKHLTFVGAFKESKVRESHLRLEKCYNRSYCIATDTDWDHVSGISG